MKKISIFIIMILSLFIVSTLYAGDGVDCFTVFDSQTIPAGGYIETLPIALSKNASNNVTALWRITSKGIFSFQPDIEGSGTVTFQVYFSDFKDPTNHWTRSPVTIVTGRTSANDLDSYPIDPNGTHLWMKIRATETGGTGSPSLSAALCSN